jgi:hypothetical protein
MIKLLMTQVALINWIPSNALHLRLVQESGPYASPVGAGNAVSAGFGAWWWIWIIIGFIILTLIVFGWHFYPSIWRERNGANELNSAQSGSATSVSGLDRGGSINTTGGTLLGAAWVFVALIVIAGLFIAGIWWWEAGLGHNYAHAPITNYANGNSNSISR